MKATEQYFPVLLFIMLYKVVLTFEYLDEILGWSFKWKLAVLSCGAVYYALQGGELQKFYSGYSCFLLFSKTNIRIQSEVHVHVWGFWGVTRFNKLPFTISKLLSSTFLWCRSLAKWGLKQSQKIKCSETNQPCSLWRLIAQGWQKCDDPSCGYTTRQVPLTRQRGAPICPSCFRAHLHPVVSEMKAIWWIFCPYFCMGIVGAVCG